MKNKMLENKGGILVICIIIFVILLIVGIVIALLITSNKEQTNNIVPENITIEENIVEEQNIIGNFIDEPEDPVEELSEINWEDKGKIVVTRTKYKDENKEYAVIPAGYGVVKESSTIKEGLVISDVENDDLDNSKGGNQFVWIPVENVVLDVRMYNNDEDINNAIAEQVSNMKYPMAIRVAGGDYKSILYQFSSIRQNTALQISFIPYDSNNVKEPANLDSSRDNANNISNWTKNMYQQEFNNLIKKVNTDKGFWVARYETSISQDGRAQSKKGQMPMTNISWYEMYNYQKSLNNGSTSSHMIWGCQWDQIMIWLKDIRNPNYKTSPFYILESTGMGNYADTTIKNEDGEVEKKEGIATRYLTGNTKCSLVRNIYDLAGNVFEWTMEKEFSAVRIARGGYCEYNSTMYPVIYRYNNATSEHLEENFGSRMTIY